VPTLISPPSHQCYGEDMPREVSQRELRNDSGAIMRALDRGESFTITRNGVVVGELTPVGRRRIVSAQALLDMSSKLPPIDAERLRADLDEVASQDPEPRA
jgi:antitoxin (DNA-binding transcriptional repressor) of toxin-antitoxin stability system